MADTQRASSWRYLPAVLAITALVVGSPLAALTLVESAYDVQMGPIPAAAVAIAFSAALGAVGSALWMRHPRSRDIVFGDLMLWGFVRRLVNERRVLRATAALGLDRSAGEVRRLAISPERQTEILQKLANALEGNDTYTHGHSKRVARHALMIAKTMNLSAEQVDKVYTAASIHDIGKLRVPHAILNKPGRLTDEEFEAVKEHPGIGAEMVADLGNGEVTAIVRHHHERLDGRGYPDGLSGDQIPLGSRIIAVADTFDALTSTRAYRDASEHKVAIDILKKESGAQLDGRVVEAFLRYYTGSRSRTWWSAITAVPQRVMGWLGNGVERIGAAGIANGVTAAGAAAVIAGASLAPSPGPTGGLNPTVGTAASSAVSADATDESFNGAATTSQDDDANGDPADERDRPADDGADGSGGDRGSGDTGSGDTGSEDTGTGGSGSGTDGSGSGSGDSGSGSDGSGSDGSDDSGSGSDSSGSGSDGSGSDNSGSGSDDSGSGSDGSGSDSSGSDPGSDDGGLIGDVVDTVEDTGCGLLGLLC